MAGPVLLSAYQQPFLRQREVPTLGSTAPCLALQQLAVLSCRSLAVNSPCGPDSPVCGESFTINTTCSDDSCIGLGRRLPCPGE